MKLGVNTMVWEKSGVNLEDSLGQINDLGYKFIDIAATGSANPKNIDSNQMKKLKELIDELGLSVSGLTMLEAKNIATFDSKYRAVQMDYAKKCARFQNNIGGEHVLFGHGCGSITMGFSRERAWVNSADFIKEYCQWLEKGKLGLSVLLELDPDVFFVINNTSRMEKMIQEVNQPNLFVNIDIGHLNVTREPPKSMEKLRDRVVHLHLNDNDGINDTHLPLGRGNVKLSSYIKKLRKLDFDNFAKNKNFEPIAALELGEEGVNNPIKAVEESEDFLYKNNLNIPKK